MKVETLLLLCGLFVAGLVTWVVYYFKRIDK